MAGSSHQGVHLSRGLIPRPCRPAMR